MSVNSSDCYDLYKRGKFVIVIIIMELIRGFLEFVTLIFFCYAFFFVTLIYASAGAGGRAGGGAGGDLAAELV